jgi:Xaa-Pro aminopeptidase
MILLFGEPISYPGNPFRQDNDFYYFTGIEEAGSVLMIIPGRKSSILFQPILSEREVYVTGPNLISARVNAEDYGFSEIVPIGSLDDYIGKITNGRGASVIYVRTSPPDFVDGGRGETDRSYEKAALLDYNEIIPPYKSRVNKLKEKYPDLIFKDIVPEIDRLRVIKTEFEQKILRINGKLSAEGVKEGMRMSKPGIYEYQIEAAAMGVVLQGGAIRAAYPPIVASGPNTCTLHYGINKRQTMDGDLVLMDFGACLDYLTIDISRTWPVNGKFSPEQKKVYKLLLEIQKACIESYKPGIKQEEVLEYVSEKVGKMNLDISGLEKYISHSMRPPVVDGQLRVENIISGFGHFVGMAVHDVGSYGNEGLKPGMVFAIEPGLYDPSTGIGIRIEDTVLITEDGCEVLTSAVPKEIDEIEQLVRK